MLKILINFAIIFQFIFYPIAANAGKKQEIQNCDAKVANFEGSDKQKEAEKNKCLAENGIIVNQAKDLKGAGTMALEMITFLIIAYSFLVLNFNQAEPAKNKQNSENLIYFAYQVTPYMALAGGLAYIITLLVYNSKFKNKCMEIINSDKAVADFKGQQQMASDYKNGVSVACQDDRLASTHTGQSTNQIIQYCKAEMCNNKQIEMATTQKNLMVAIEVVFGLAIVVELANVIANVTRGAMGCIPPATEDTCPYLMDFYGYALQEDVEIKDNDQSTSYNNFKNRKIDFLVKDQLKNNLFTKNLNQIIHSSNKLDSSLILLEYQRFSKGYIKSMTIGEYETMSKFMAKEKNESNPFRSLSKEVLALFTLPEAHADFNVGSALSLFTSLGSIAGFNGFGGLKDGIMEALKKTYTTPVGRMAVYGLALGLADKQRTHIKNTVLPNLYGRNQTYDGAIKDLYRLGINPLPTGTPTPTPTPKTTQNVASAKGGKDQQQEKFDTCLNSDLTVDEKCSCRAKGTCQSNKMPNMDLGKVNIPNSLMKSTDVITDYGNSLSKGESLKANNLLSTGFDHQNAMNLVAKMKKQYKDESTKNKQPYVDIDKESKKLESKLLQIAQDKLGSGSSSSLNNIASALSGAPSIGADANNNKAQEIESLLNKSAVNTGTANTAPANDGFNLGLLDETNKTNDDLALLSEKTSEIDPKAEYEIPEVSQSKSENIFNILSNRYFKSAYPKLLKEEK